MLHDLWRVLTLLVGFVFGIYVAVLLHESGHALGAILHGDRVYAIVMQIPAPAGYVQASSSSWMLTWGGVFFGALFSLPPLLLARLLSSKSMGRFAALLVSALCLAHNGLYLAVGSIIPFADAAGMVDRGAPRWFLFVLGVPLLAGFIVVLSRAIVMIGLRPADSVSKWIIVAELGLLPLPALAVAATVLAPGQQHGATMLAMVLWGAAYAGAFATAALRARSMIMARSADFENLVLPPRWSATFTLFLGALLVIILELLVCRPVASTI